eukprot:528350-Rhodomonas_salina.1
MLKAKLPRICLCAPYAVPGTDLWHGPTRLRGGSRGTTAVGRRCRGATTSPRTVLCVCYAPMPVSSVVHTPSPVLIYGLLLGTRKEGSYGEGYGVRVHRAALESDYVTRELPKWIDLMFGIKQGGRKAKVIACAATQRPVLTWCIALPGTDPRGAEENSLLRLRTGPGELSAYAPAMRCPVLMWRMCYARATQSLVLHKNHPEHSRGPVPFSGTVCYLPTRVLCHVRYY